MNIVNLFHIASGALLVNKLRSALTMLGVVIGVAGVITSMSVGAGATEQLNKQFELNLGSRLIIVRSGSVTSFGRQLRRSGAGTLLECARIAQARTELGIEANARLE